METKDYFSFLVNEIHTTVVATVDDEGLPVTAAIDMMDYDENSFTSLPQKEKASMTGSQNEDFWRSLH